MELSEAIRLVKQGLRFRTGMDAEIIAAMKKAQFEFEAAETHPWFLIEEEAAIAITAATQSVSLASIRFLAEVEDALPHYVSDDYGFTQLKKRRLDENNAYYASYEAGRPLAYTMLNTSLKIYPVPDDDYTLYWSYYKGADPAYEGDSFTNSWLTGNPYRLIARAGFFLAADMEDQASAEKFSGDYQLWTRWQHNEVAKREADGMPMAMGRNN